MTTKEESENSKVDYCGPEANPFLSALIPDRIAFVDFSECCKEHDEDYKKGGDEKTKKSKDKKFHRCLKCRILKTVGWLRQWFYRPFAFLYYRAVSRAGKSCFNYRKLSSVPEPSQSEAAGVSSGDQSRVWIANSKRTSTE